MRRFKIYTLLICLYLAVASVYAESSDNVRAEFEQRLSAASSTNRSIVARFSQQKKVAGIKEDVTTHGDFYYDNSGDMAMIYDSPEGDKVVMNGESFTIIVGGKRIESSAQNPMMAQISYMMQASMTGDVQKLGRGWDLTMESDEVEYRVVVEPIDRRVKRYITSMTMVFDTKTLTLNTLRIDERSGGFTIYNFYSKQINRAVDRKYFIP